MFERVQHQDQFIDQTFHFDQPVINIGSHPENDILLAGQGVSPFHALVHSQAGNHHLVTLDPQAEICVNGIPLEETSLELSGHQEIEIGRYVLRFQGNGFQSGLQVSIHPMNGDRPVQAPARFVMNQGEEAILVNVLSQETDIAVEQSVEFELEVVNAGPIVASFYGSVQGLHPEWVEIREPVFNLNEGQRTVLHVRVTPPREPASTAGIHPFSIEVASPNYPGHTVSTSFELNIQPYYEFVLGNLTPKQQRIPWRKHTGLVHLPISNQGNSPTEFLVSAIDDENGCSFDFNVNENLQLTRQATVTIPDGDDFVLPIEITPLKQALFALRSKRYHFTTTVQVAQQISSPQTISASVTSLPLFGWWSIMLGILVTLISLFILLQPRIHSFELVAGKDIIELGDTTKLAWSVSPFATRVNISNLDESLNRGQRSITIAPAQSTTYELVAGNWLSGLLGLDRKASQTVLVVPPSPQIGVFEVDTTTVDKGSPVNLRWSVTQADQVFLTIDEVIYELSPEEFSGEQAFILEKDALLTLEAVNPSGSKLRSYFVNVVPPHITINAFTVWVRPEGSAANSPESNHKSSGGRLASRVFVPDANFPEEYVTMLPDTSSDSGYRAEFLQPDRELAKGEQVLLEWDVDGVESVMISPFTEVLPNRGAQPFFPQESMNFVMTAKSGELEQIYMLPVKVFDGIPPEAPTIEFFKASPVKMVGGGPVEFAWSVSGEWTRVQLASGDAIVADYLNPQGFKTVNVSKSSTFILTAWNGPDLSSAAPVEITVDPALKSLDLNITEILPDSSYFSVGDTIDVFIDFVDPDTGEQPNPYPTGEVIVSDGHAVCTIELPKRVCTLTFNAAGTKTGNDGIRASYPGDSLYLPVDSDIFSDRIIIVESNQIILSPVYYHIDQNGDKGTKIDDLSDPTPPLSVGRGFIIEISVIPVNQPLLPDDEKGRITTRYCKYVNGVIDDQNCVTLLQKTVKVIDETLGKTEVVIKDLYKTGVYALIISYSHSEDAYEPVTLGADGSILFTVEKGVLALLPDGVDPCDFDQCTLLQDQGNYIFDPYLLIENNWQKLLSPLYSEPNPIEMVLYYTGGGGEDWSSKCDWRISGDHWQYYCQNITLDQPATLKYEFQTTDPNYVLKSEPTVNLVISVKLATSLVFPNGDDFLKGNLVGTGIELQSGNIVLQDRSGNPVAGEIKTRLQKDGQSIDKLSDYLTTITSPTTCGINGDTLTFTQDAITTTVETCQIAFNQSGSYKLLFSYDGNNTYNGATAEKNLEIGRQTGIEAVWNPDGPYNWEIFTTYPVTITFGCPGSEPECTDFSDTVLDGATLQIDLSQAPACSVKQGNILLPDGTFDIFGTSANLSFRCTELGVKTFNLKFVNSSVDDFNLAGGETKGATVSPMKKTTKPEIRIATGSQLLLIGDPVDVITNQEWWVEEEYWVIVKLENMPADANILDDAILMQWPLALTNALSGDSSKTNCPTPSLVGTDTSEFKLPLTKVTNGSTSWEAKCKFTFASGTNLAQNDTISFEFDSDRFSEEASDLSIDLPAEVYKRTPNITITVPSDPIYTLLGSTFEIQITDSHYKFDAIDFWQNDLTITVNGVNLPSTECSRSGNILACKLPDESAWTGSIVVVYDENNIFASVNKTLSGVNVIATPVKLMSVVGNFPEIIQCETCNPGDEFYNPTPYAFKSTDYSLTFKVESETGVSVNKGNIVVTFENTDIREDAITHSGSNVTETCTKIGSQRYCIYKIPVSGNQATFSWTINNAFLPDVQYSYEYEDNNNSFTQSTNANNGWVSSINSRWRNLFQFGVDTWFRTADSRYHLLLTNLPASSTFNFRLEVGGCTTTTNPDPITCEGDAASCWNGSIIVGGDSSGEDAKVVTDPNWARLVGNDFGCQYQIILTDRLATTLYFGIEQSGGWPP